MTVPDLTSESFAPLTGSDFEVLLPGHDPIRLTLGEISVLEEVAAPEPIRRVPFSLIFTGPLQPTLQQNTYDVEHPDLGIFPLFLVPIGPAADLMRYEAVFG